MSGADSDLPQPDETLSSWLARWLGIRQVSQASWRMCLDESLIGLASQLALEPDFPAGSLWRAVVAQWTRIPVSRLETLGRPATPWFLAPSARCTVCIACLAEDGPPGLQYMRTIWTDSWRTVCHRHDFPLIKVPAVGWRWSEFSPSRRRSYAGLMHRPSEACAKFRRWWSELPYVVRRGSYAVEIALLEAWSEQCALGHPDAAEAATGSRLRVWQDLLTLCSYSWGSLSEPSLAGAALPANWVDRSALLRVPQVAPFAQRIGSQPWRFLDDPAERRTVMLCVGDAMLGLSAERTERRERHRVWGWPAVLPQIPAAGMRWLLERTEAWPVMFRYEAQAWQRAGRRTGTRSKTGAP